MLLTLLTLLLLIVFFIAVTSALLLVSIEANIKKAGAISLIISVGILAVLIIIIRMLN